MRAQHELGRPFADHDARGHRVARGDRRHDRGIGDTQASHPVDAQRPIDLAVNANFLSDQRDVQALLRAVALCREIGNSPRLQAFARREIMPGPLGARATQPAVPPPQTMKS